MTVFDRAGTERYSLTLNGDAQHDKAQIEEIKKKTFNLYDVISFYGLNTTSVRIYGDIVSKSMDYSNGFGNEDKYSKVRFQITNDGLKEIQEPIFTVTGVEPLTIKRGNEPDLEDGVAVTLQNTFSEDYKVTVDKKNFNYMTEGEYIVTYKITSSWNNTYTVDRTIIVEPRNELEKVRLKLKNSQGNNILTLGFDTITNQLKLLNYDENAQLQVNDLNKSLVLTAYNELGAIVGNIELGNTINQDFIDRINKFVYYNGLTLSVWAQDYSNLSIEGPIECTNYDKYDYSNGINDLDKLKNVRFTIQENGLKSTYNKAPEIIVDQQEIVYYKGNILDAYVGLRVNDDLDKTINVNEIVFDDSKVNYDQDGKYDIYYTVEDSWGRKSDVATRKVVVKSGLLLNTMEFYSLKNSSSESDSNSSIDSGNGSDGGTENAPELETYIDDTSDNQNPSDESTDEDGANSEENENPGDESEDDESNPDDNPSDGNEQQFNGVFKIAFEDGKINVIKGSNSNEQLDSNKSNTEVLRIGVYNGKSEVIKEVSLNGDDTGESEKLKNIDQYVLGENDYIAIENISEKFAGNSVKIKGKVLNSKEDYSNGIQTMDYIENVRFKLSQYGLEAVYNNAPNIKFTGTLDGMLGDELDYLKNAILTDDHDELNISNIRVELINDSQSGTTTPNNSNSGGIQENPSLINDDEQDTTFGNVNSSDTNFTTNNNNNSDNSSNIADPDKGWKIGENRVKYIVTDLWGRSIEVERTINLTNALPNIEIQFMGHRENVSEENAEVALKMKFNISDSNKTISFESGEDMYFRKGNETNIEYKVILIKERNGTTERIEGTAQGQDKANNTSINLIHSLNNQTFEYGDKIQFFAWHQDLLRIQGPVRNGIEDYSDGVQLGDAYTNVTFEITPAGLKSTYTPNEDYSGNLINSIIPSAREGFPFILKVDGNTKIITVHDRKPYSIEFGTTERAFEEYC